MDKLKRISEAFQSAKEIPFDEASKIVIMSDCHRGDGSLADDFAKNQNLYFAALTHYYDKNYTYIEVGDGDELWENSNISDIIHMYNDVFWLLSKFFNEGRLYFIYGNHDMVKKDKEFVKNNLYKYYDYYDNGYKDLFQNVEIHEGLILKHKVTQDKIYITHGHQGEWIDDQMWKLGKFLVRHVWKPLELFGVNDPTSTAKNYQRKAKAEKKFIGWVKKEKHMLVTGHTHRPMFPEVGEPPYFNDGSCVHPKCITALEITCGFIMLVKWCIRTKEDNTLFIAREVIAGPRKLKEYFKNLK